MAIFLPGTLSTLSAANGTWSGGGSSGNWSDTANWGNGSVAGATSGTTNTDAATLPAGVSNRTLTLDSDINVGSILYTPGTGGNSYTINASPGFALRLSSGTGITINTSVNSGAANTLTINAPIILEAASPTTNGTHSTYSRNSNYLDLAGSISGGTTTGTVSLLIDGNSTGKTFVSGNISDGNATSGVAVEIKANHVVSLNGTNTFSAGLTLNSTSNNNIVAAQTGTNTKLGTGTITVLNKAPRRFEWVICLKRAACGGR